LCFVNRKAPLFHILQAPPFLSEGRRALVSKPLISRKGNLLKNLPSGRLMMGFG
jgi:hypothetical protein